VPRKADTSLASNVNDQPSLFNDIKEPLRDDDTPLAGYTDLQLATIIETWQKKYKK